ncbi:hypothetical protein [Arthrobacter sp. TMN-50]
MRNTPPELTDDDARRPAAVVGPGEAVVGSHSDRGATHDSRVSSLWWALAMSVVLGLVVAILGTALHSQVWEMPGVTLPIGAAAAVLLAGSAAVFAALWARNVYLSPVVGGTAYLVVGLFAASEDQPLVLTDLGMSPPLPTAIAGSIWVFGLAIVTVLASMLSWWVLRPRRAVRAS